MKFKKLLKLLERQYDNYIIPKDDKNLLIADFYVIEGTLNYPTKQGAKDYLQYRTQYDEAVTAMKQARDTIVPYMKNMLTQDIFWSIQCEWRHAYTYNKIEDIFNLAKSKIEQQFIRAYYSILSGAERAEGTYFDGYRTRSFRDENYILPNLYSETGLLPTPKFDDYYMKMIFDSCENADHRHYYNRYKVLDMAMNYSGITAIDFVKLCKRAFDGLEWSRSYGGAAWSRIADGYFMLLDSTGTKNDMVAIDFAIDLQHNSGSIFTKNPLYDGFDDELLNIKRDLPITDFSDKASPHIRELSNIILHAKGYESASQFGAAKRAKERLEKAIEKDDMMEVLKSVEAGADINSYYLLSYLVGRYKDGKPNLGTKQLIIKILQAKQIELDWSLINPLFLSAMKQYGMDIIQLLYDNGYMKSDILSQFDIDKIVNWIVVHDDVAMLKYMDGKDSRIKQTLENTPGISKNIEHHKSFQVLEYINKNDIKIK